MLLGELPPSLLGSERTSAHFLRGSEGERPVTNITKITSTNIKQGGSARARMRRGATAFFVVTVVTLASVLPATQGLRGSAYPAAELARSVDSQHNHRHHQHEGKEGMLRRCFEDLKELVKEKSCAPLLVRLAWHEAGTYDKNYHNGGADGTIRFDKGKCKVFSSVCRRLTNAFASSTFSELAHPNDAGLENARALLQPMKQSYPDISYADLYQMASAAAIEASGGPRIPMRYGRVDAETDASVPPVNRLPDGRGPFHQGNGPCPFAWSWNPSPADHLRRVFHRMGLNDKEIVALSGGHTLGRAYKDRSGLPPLNETKYTVDGPGTRGGMSWTRDWLRFDNSYFSRTF